jgi:nitroreductase
MIETHDQACEKATEFLKQRYGEAIPIPPELVNPVLPVLLSHRSVRAYADKPLPDGLLDVALSAAQSASTSSNLHLWSVVAVEDKARKDRLAALCGNQQHIRDCPLFLAWLADGSRVARAAEAQGVRAKGLDYVEAVMLAVVDAALAAQNAVVAMESLGLGVVYIGGLRNNMDKVAEELRLPPYVFGCFGMCVGWPSESAGASVKPRLAQPAILHRETYSVDQEAAPIAAYDATLKEFQERVGMKPVGWQPTIARRMGSKEALTGRDRLREIMEGVGFLMR